MVDLNAHEAGNGERAKESLPLVAFSSTQSQSGASGLGPNGRQHPPSAQYRSRTRAESHDDLEGIHSVAHERARRGRLLHGGGAYVERSGDLLRAVLHGSRQPPRIVGRHHTPSGLELDDASGAQRHDAGHRIPERLSLPAARSGSEVLPGIARHAGERGREVPAAPTQKSQFERPRGTLGPYHQRGVSIQADLVWGALATACRVRFPGALSSRENHQDTDNLLLFPVSALQDRNAPRAIRCRERLGGLLKYYGRIA